MLENGENATTPLADGASENAGFSRCCRYSSLGILQEGPVWCGRRFAAGSVAKGSRQCHALVPHWNDLRNATQRGSGKERFAACFADQSKLAQLERNSQDLGLEKLDGNGVMPKPPISPAPPVRGTGEPVPAVPRKARVQGEDLPVFSSSLSAS